MCAGGGGVAASPGAPRVKSSVDGCSNIQMGYGTIIVGATVDMDAGVRILIRGCFFRFHWMVLLSLYPFVSSKLWWFWTCDNIDYTAGQYLHI